MRPGDVRKQADVINRVSISGDGFQTRSHQRRLAASMLALTRGHSIFRCASY